MPDSPADFSVKYPGKQPPNRRCGRPADCSYSPVPGRAQPEGFDCDPRHCQGIVRMSSLSRYRRWLGHRTPPALPSGFVPMGTFVDRDVFIAGYPKSGNTWLQLMMASLLYGLDPRNAPDTLVQELVPDVHYKNCFKRFLQAMCFKTHSLPQPEYRRVIRLVRDGRDVICSYHHFNESSQVGGPLDSLVDGATPLPFGEWQDHVLAWERNPFRADTILVRYEDLLDDCVGELGRISDFLGVHRSPAELAAIAKGSRFDCMKTREAAQGWDNKAWPKDKPFVRQGRSGAYTAELSPAQIARFTCRSAAALRLLGYEPCAGAA